MKSCASRTIEARKAGLFDAAMDYMIPRTIEEPVMRALSRTLGAISLALAALGLAGPAAPQQQKAVTVDLELVLAIDVSQSMDIDEHTLQRMGYVEAFRHKDVINAILSGPQGRIAVTVMEWAGDFEPIDLT